MPSLRIAGQRQFARLYLERGDLRSLQAILGHASITTTAGIYLDPDIDDLRQKHRQTSPLNRILEKAGSQNIHTS